MQKDPLVVGTGLVALDVVLNGDVENSRLYAGGTCCNVLTILAWLGWQAFPIARLGADDAGRSVSTDLKRFGVKLDLARLTPRAPTPIIIERLRRSSDSVPKHHFSVNCPVCGSWLPRYQPVTIDAANQVLTRVVQPSVFFFDRASRGALVLASAYAASGSLIVFEPSGRAEDQLQKEALRLAHVCKYSTERFEGFHWTGDTRPLLEVQTMGSGGSRYRSWLPSTPNEEWHSVSALNVANVKDTAGAGDWFSAGLIHKLGRTGLAGLKSARPEDLDSAICLGKALAAWNCQFEGARGGMYFSDKAAFDEQIRELLSGQRAPSQTNRILRLPRSMRFRCPVSACTVSGR
jgi:sugar/nucleoside kinase (ribokinase family)